MTTAVAEAIITEDNKVKCPYCGKVNGVLTGHETVRNYKIRCRASRKNQEHFFVLNVEGEQRND